MSSSTKEIKEKDGDREKKRRRTIKTAEIRSASPNTGSEIKKLKVESKSSGALTTRSLYAVEEKEVDFRDPLSDLAAQKGACNEIRQMMTKINTLKDQGKEDMIEEPRIHGTLQFVTLKKLNRLAQIRCRKGRDATSEAKLKLDHRHLQLQNLLYEVTHLQKEITKCLEFKSKDEDIDLVAVDEFYKDAPPDIAKPDLTKNDPHQQKLARLDWELEQRKRLAKKLDEASGSKDMLVQESKTKREYLESLQPKLNNILAATKPVQDYMGMPFDELREQHLTACYLPRPLYVLYMQASAFKDACDKDLTVSIHGDIDVAKALSNQAEDVEEDSDSDQEDEGKRSSKRRRRRAEDRKTQKKQKMLKKHPLTVVLDVKCKDGSVLHLTFAHLVAFGIVTVTVKLTAGAEMTFTSISGGDLMSPDSILMSLYSDDLGMDTPNPSNNYALSRMGLGEFTLYISEVGRPYDWVQRMAGLQFLRVQPDDEMRSEVKTTISASCMEDTIRRLRSRVRARQALQKHLAALERSNIPVSNDDQHMFIAKITARLTSWKRTTYQDFQMLPYAARMINEGIGNEWDMYFVGIMERGSAKLTFHVVLSADHPTSAPVFAINIHWKHQRNNLNDEHVRDMEAEVNIHYEELLQNKSHDQLLPNQVQRLLMCFDVYLETESENSALEGPIEFSKDKIFPRFTRGPGRGKPYVYQYKMGFFSQR